MEIPEARSLLTSRRCHYTTQLRTFQSDIPGQVQSTGNINPRPRSLGRNGESGTVAGINPQIPRTPIPDSACAFPTVCTPVKKHWAHASTKNGPSLSPSRFTEIRDYNYRLLSMRAVEVDESTRGLILAAQGGIVLGNCRSNLKRELLAELHTPLIIGI